MRFITAPLTRRSYESSAKMKVVAPLQKEVQEKYKGNPQKIQKENTIREEIDANSVGIAMVRKI